MAEYFIFSHIYESTVVPESWKQIDTKMIVLMSL